jgi:hypothetical protein
MISKTTDLYLQEFGYDIDKAITAGHAATALTDEQIGVMWELETLSGVLTDAYDYVMRNKKTN